MILYFNHGSLNRISETDALKYLIEFAGLTRIAMQEKAVVKVSSSIWGLKLAGPQTLQQFIYKLAKDKKDYEIVGVVIQSIMSSTGSFFEERATGSPVGITPTIPPSSMGESLLHTCFVDDQPNMLSFHQDTELPHGLYTISNAGKSHVVNNVLGPLILGMVLQDLRQFDSIENVFLEIETRYDSIRILDSARHSAKRHFFRGGLQGVFMALQELVETEQPNIVDGVTEDLRISLFSQMTNGMEISGESKKTLRHPKYRGEREFTIPELGKRIFEWHVKLDGTHTRIHYYVDKMTRLLYIGHCGKHLGTSSYDS